MSVWIHSVVMNGTDVYVQWGFLCLIKHHVMLQAFLNSTLDGGKWSALRPDHFSSRGKNPPLPLHRRLVGSRVGLEAIAKRINSLPASAGSKKKNITFNQSLKATPKRIDCTFRRIRLLSFCYFLESSLFPILLNLLLYRELQIGD
jgi:hypothetical protein